MLDGKSHTISTVACKGVPKITTWDGEAQGLAFLNSVMLDRITIRFEVIGKLWN